MTNELLKDKITVALYQKGREEEEYTRPPWQRESLVGCKAISRRIVEGSFGTGYLN